jgi:class 3 adenylate cyclase
VALNVEKVTEFIAPEADWLDNRYCGKDDDTFYRELPEAEVLWHVAAVYLRRRPRAGATFASRAQAGRRENTTDVETATRLGIAVANMPGPTDTRRQSAARPGQRGADPARHLVGRSVARRYDGHHRTAVKRYLRGPQRGWCRWTDRDGVPCGSCGAQSSPTAKFCSECGTALAPATRSAEYKQVTVLFADVVHSMDIAAAVGAERLREIMTELVERSAAVVQHYSGTVEFTGDGVMAIFGAPVALLEDHAVRACLAALGVQEEAKRLADEVQRCDGADLRLRIGLNSGQVIAGEIGSGALGYTAIGEQVGMAQRMESIAPPGGVMLSASTARLVEGAASLAEPELVQIKGADKPVAAQRLLGMEERLASSSASSRIWSGGGGRCSPLKPCWTGQLRGTAVSSVWWGHLASARAVWCAKCLRWRPPVVSRCSPLSASRTPVRSPSMPSRGCCAQPPASMVLKGGRPVTECATGLPTQTPRIRRCLMTCWASLTHKLRVYRLAAGGTAVGSQIAWQ